MKKCNFWYNISFLMFNLSVALKNSIDNENNINCNFSECARFIRAFMIGKINKNTIKKDINIIKKNKYTKEYNKYSDRQNKAGSYKSINKIKKINKEYNEKPD